MATFSDTEIQTIRNLLGYGNLTALALPYIERTMVFEQVVQNFTDDYGIDYVRTTILPNMAQIDVDIQSARSRYKVDKAEDYTQDKNEHGRYLRLREYWISRLEDTLKVYRFKGDTSPGGGWMDVY